MWQMMWRRRDQTKGPRMRRPQAAVGESLLQPLSKHSHTCTHTDNAMTNNTRKQIRHTRTSARVSLAHASVYCSSVPESRSRAGRSDGHTKQGFFPQGRGGQKWGVPGANLFNAGAVQGPGGRTCPTEPANTRLHMHENLTYTDMRTHTIQFAADILARSAAGTRQCEPRRKNENNLS